MMNGVDCAHAIPGTAAAKAASNTIALRTIASWKRRGGVCSAALYGCDGYWPRLESSEVSPTLRVEGWPPEFAPAVNRLPWFWLVDATLAPVSGLLPLTSAVFATLALDSDEVPPTTLVSAPVPVNTSVAPPRPSASATGVTRPETAEVTGPVAGAAEPTAVESAVSAWFCGNVTLTVLPALATLTPTNEPVAGVSERIPMPTGCVAAAPICVFDTSADTGNNDVTGWAALATEPSGNAALPFDSSVLAAEVMPDVA